MTALDPALQKPSWGMKRLFWIAFPMIISQGTETVMMFVDRLFLSQVSLVHMSAAMSGGLASFVFMSLFLGLTGYVNTQVAHFHGADQKDKGVFSTTQGFYLALSFYPVVLVSIPLIAPLFQYLGHDPAQVELEKEYFMILMAGSFLALGRSVLAGYFTGIGKTALVMGANLSAMVINIPLNFILIFGWGPIAPLGIGGAAIGTLLGSFTALVFLLIAYLLRPEVQEQFKKGILKFRPLLMKKLLRFGLPVGIELFLNVFAFNLFLQLMHSYSAGVASAVTIVLSFDMLAFIPMMGMGIGVSALVGQELGAGKVEGARYAKTLGLRMALIYAGSMGLVFLFGAPVLVSLFNPPGPAFDPQVQALATIMLRLTALYTMADATQIVYGGALRGAGDTKWVMVINSSLHWLVAILAVVGILVFRWPPLLLWGLMILVLFLIAGGMFFRYRLGGWEKIVFLDDEGKDRLGTDPYQERMMSFPLDPPDL